MSLLVESAEVTVFGYKDRFSSYEGSKSYPYLHIVGAKAIYGDTEQDSLPLELDRAQLVTRSIRLSAVHADRLVRLVNRRESQGPNCHGFIRYMYGYGARPPINCEPLVKTFHNLPRVTSIDQGKIGVIGDESDGSVLHSMMGIGNGESLQVMSRHSELGISEDQLVLDFYRHEKSTRAVHLYQVNQTATGLIQP